MFLAEFTTESGAVYTANVVRQRLRRIGPDGTPSEWVDYKELQGGHVGERLVITYPQAEIDATKTTPVVKLAFPKVD